MNDLFFIHILYSIFINKKTGILYLKRLEENFKIFFENGSIVNILSNYIPTLSIGEYLIEKNYISQNDRDEALEKSKLEKKELGTILIRDKNISPYIIFEAIRIIGLKKILYLAKNFENFFYHFKKLPKIDKRYNILVINTEKVLYENIKEICNLTQVKETFKKFLYSEIEKDINSLLKTDNLNLQPFESKILSNLSTPKTLRYIISELSGDINEIIKSLYAFLILNIVVFKDESESIFKIDSDAIIKQIESTPLTSEEEAELENYQLLSSLEDDKNEGGKDNFSVLINEIHNLLQESSLFQDWEKKGNHLSYTDNSIAVIKLSDENELIREIKKKAYLGY